MRENVAIVLVLPVPMLPVFNWILVLAIGYIIFFRSWEAAASAKGMSPQRYRTIHLGIQGNSLAYTGKVLRAYRRIRLPLQGNSMER